MAIIAIISLAVYTGYIFVIKNIKQGQVKQSAALEGKKIIEEIKSQNIKLPAMDNEFLNIGDSISLAKQGNAYTRFLNDKFQGEYGNDIPESLRKYAEVLTITKTATDSNKAGSVDLNYYEVPKNAYEINISNQFQNNSIQSFINTRPIPELGNQNEILLSLYVEDGGKIEINDFQGNPIELPIKKAKVDNEKINIVINFNDYEERNNVALKKVDINVYNKTTSGTLNIYVQKSEDVTSNIQIFKGKMDLYDNRAENQGEANIGTLHNIKVELMEYTQYIKDQTMKTHDERNNLFTANYNKNIAD